MADENIITELKKPIATRLDVILTHAPALMRRLKEDKRNTVFIVNHVLGEEIFTREELEVGLAYLRLQGKLRALGYDTNL